MNCRNEANEFQEVALPSRNWAKHGKCCRLHLLLSSSQGLQTFGYLWIKPRLNFACAMKSTVLSTKALHSKEVCHLGRGVLECQVCSKVGLTSEVTMERCRIRDRQPGDPAEPIETTLMRCF